MLKRATANQTRTLYLSEDLLTCGEFRERIRSTVTAVTEACRSGAFFLELQVRLFSMTGIPAEFVWEEVVRTAFEASWRNASTNSVLGTGHDEAEAAAFTAVFSKHILAREIDRYFLKHMGAYTFGHIQDHCRSALCYMYRDRKTAIRRAFQRLDQEERINTLGLTVEAVTVINRYRAIRAMSTAAAKRKDATEAAFTLRVYLLQRLRATPRPLVTKRNRATGDMDTVYVAPWYFPLVPQPFARKCVITIDNLGASLLLGDTRADQAGLFGGLFDPGHPQFTKMLQRGFALPASVQTDGTELSVTCTKNRAARRTLPDVPVHPPSPSEEIACVAGLGVLFGLLGCYSNLNDVWAQLRAARAVMLILTAAIQFSMATTWAVGLFTGHPFNVVVAYLFGLQVGHDFAMGHFESVLVDLCCAAAWTVLQMACRRWHFWGI